MKRGKSKRGSSLKRNPFFKLAAFGTAGLTIGGNALGESIITFGGFAGDNTPIGTIPGYGDNINANSADYTVSAGIAGVVGTPNISLDWLGGWDTYTAWDGRGNVAQSDFNGGLPSIVFTPTSLTGVRLLSFHLDEWAGGGAGNIAWSITGPTSGALASGNWTMSNSGGRIQVSPFVTGRVGESLTLSLQLVSGLGSYFAIDNLTFDQVPEPSAVALGALGAVALGAAGMRRRRRA